jgi:hypothetical protein
MGAEPTEIFRKGHASRNVAEVSDGYVFYDRFSGQIFFLNLTAAAVLELCDGIRSAALIADILKESFGLMARPIDEVNACLQSLVSAGLVEEVRNDKVSSQSFFFRFFSQACKT